MRGKLAGWSWLMTFLTVWSGCSSPRDLSPSPFPIFVEASEGVYLEKLDLNSLEPVAPRRLIRPDRADHFTPHPRRIRILSNPDSTQSVAASLDAARPKSDTRFVYPGAPGAEARLQWAVFTGKASRDPGPSLSLDVDGTKWNIIIPPGPRRLLWYSLPLEATDSAREQPLVVSIDSSGLPNRFFMTEPFITVPTSDPVPSVILISLDALRADTWTSTHGRVPSLDAFHDDALRFRHAYSSFPTTSRSHGVILSGLYPEELRTTTLDQQTSVAGVLRQHGRISQGFVAGGLLRARFGYGGRPPGFALGFDLYLEDLPLHPHPRRRASNPRHRKGPRRHDGRGRHDGPRRRHGHDRSPLHARDHQTQPPGGGSTRTRERSHQPVKDHTLGAALARSLDALKRVSGTPVFQFLHGYDVHDYRTVNTIYWEQVVAEHPDERPAIEACLARVGATFEGDRLVHFPYESLYRLRKTGHLGDLEPCHRRITQLMYQARVHSVQDMLGRYLEALRALGVYDRALIIVTSDHGESLLDEKGRDGAYQWGHNRVLANNLRVPMWIKPPGARGAGRDIDDVAGLVDLRTTILASLGIHARADRGTNLLASPIVRRVPLAFSSTAGEFGVVLEDNTICAWKDEHAARPSRYPPRGVHESRRTTPGQPSPSRDKLPETGARPVSSLRVHTGAGWLEPDPATARRCLEARAKTTVQRSVAPAAIPADLEEELRVLGYAE